MNTSPNQSNSGLSSATNSPDQGSSPDGGYKTDKSSPFTDKPLEKTQLVSRIEDRGFLIDGGSSSSLPSAAEFLSNAAQCPREYDYQDSQEFSDTSHDSWILRASIRGLNPRRIEQDSQAFTESSCDSWASLPSLPSTSRRGIDVRDNQSNIEADLLVSDSSRDTCSPPSVFGGDTNATIILETDSECSRESFVFPSNAQKRTRPDSKCSPDGSPSSPSIISQYSGCVRETIMIQDRDDTYEPDPAIISELQRDPYAPRVTCYEQAMEQQRKKRRPEQPKSYGRTELEYMILADRSASMEHMAVTMFYDLLTTAERTLKLNLAFHGQTDPRIIAIYEKVKKYYDTADLTDSEIYMKVRRGLMISNRFQIKQDNAMRRFFAKNKAL